jgi:hypothetical protein
MLLIGCPWCELEVELVTALDAMDFVCPSCLTRVRWVAHEEVPAPATAPLRGVGDGPQAGEARQLAPAA